MRGGRKLITIKKPELSDDEFNLDESGSFPSERSYCHLTISSIVKLGIILILLGAAGYIIYYFVSKSDTINATIDCNDCNKIISLLQDMFTSDKSRIPKTSEVIKKISTLVCATLGFFNLDEIPCSTGDNFEQCKDMCSGIVNTYIKAVETSLYTSSNLPIYACHQLSPKCPLDIPCAIETNLSSALQTTLDVEEESIFNDEMRNGRILLLTDIHLDLYYHNNTDSFCGDSVCCEERYEIGSSGYYADTSSGLCEISTQFLEKFTCEYNQNYGPFDAVFILGDYADHALARQSISYNYAEIVETHQILKKCFGKTPIIDVLGNHDIFPVNHYTAEKNDEWIYTLLNNFVHEDIPLDLNYVNTTISTGGFYTVKMFDGLRIIVLNSNFYHDDNLATIGKCNDTSNQLSWLNKVLEKSQNNNEQVIILAHGHYTDFINAFKNHFINLMKKYSNYIRGYFFGHWHQYKICFMKNDTEPILLEISPNTVSTYGSQVTNPGFAVLDYRYTNSSFNIENISYQIIDVNKFNNASESNYILTYDLDLNYTDIKSMFDTVKEKVVYYRNSTNNSDDPILKKIFSMDDCKSLWWE